MIPVEPSVEILVINQNLVVIPLINTLVPVQIKVHREHLVMANMQVVLVRPVICGKTEVVKKLNGELVPA